MKSINSKAARAQIASLFNDVQAARVMQQGRTDKDSYWIWEQHAADALIALAEVYGIPATGYKRAKDNYDDICHRANREYDARHAAA